MRLVFICAGIPTAVELLGTSCKTTLFAPTLTLSPIVTGPKTFAPEPIITSEPIVGCLLKVFSFPVAPIVAPW